MGTLRSEPVAGSLQEFHQILVQNILESTQRKYGPRLVSLVVYGSVGRGTPQPESDIDLLLVIDALPSSRLERQAEFEAVEKMVSPFLEYRKDQSSVTRLSPIIKSREECLAGSPLFLDMVEDAWIVEDKESFFHDILASLKDRLKKLGSQRIWRGSAWYWDLKPDYQIGDEIEL
jgi:predicted nucleotidyltransferase